jgi:hypothetical protein
MGRVLSDSAKGTSSACILWNPRQTIRVNNHVIATESFRLSDLTSIVRGGTNTLDVNIDATHGGGSRGLVFFIYGRSLTASETCYYIRQASSIVHMIRAPPMIPHPVFDHKTLIVQLRDHQGKKLRVPCRTMYCKHPECFDLLSCVEAVGPLLHVGITCPICSTHAPPSHVVIDTFVESLLANAKEENIPLHGKMLVRISTPGENIWRERTTSEDPGEIWRTREDETWTSKDILRSPIILSNVTSGQEPSSPDEEEIDRVVDMC